MAGSGVPAPSLRRPGQRTQHVPIASTAVARRVGGCSPQGGGGLPIRHGADRPTRRVWAARSGDGGDADRDPPRSVRGDERLVRERTGADRYGGGRLRERDAPSGDDRQHRSDHRERDVRATDTARKMEERIPAGDRRIFRALQSRSTWRGSAISCCLWWNGLNGRRERASRPSATCGRCPRCGSNEPRRSTSPCWPRDRRMKGPDLWGREDEVSGNFSEGPLIHTLRPFPTSTWASHLGGFWAFANMRANGEVAPISAVRRTAIGRLKFYPTEPFIGQERCG